jgi:hypothetical protein
MRGAKLFRVGEQDRHGDGEKPGPLDRRIAGSMPGVLVPDPLACRQRQGVVLGSQRLMRGPVRGLALCSRCGLVGLVHGRILDAPITTPARV